MSCECQMGYICVPRGDSVTVVFTVHEDANYGPYMDISGADEIVFIVADSHGGTVRITKELSLGEISISTNNYQFYTTLTSAETDTLVQVTNYFECRVTSPTGENRTVARGVFKSPNTMIKDLA